ncbi:MAG: hypothetical protein ACLT2F_07155 [Butyricicoccus sp.]
MPEKQAAARQKSMRLRTYRYVGAQCLHDAHRYDGERTQPAATSSACGAATARSGRSALAEEMYKGLCCRADAVGHSGPACVDGVCTEGKMSCGRAAEGARTIDGARDTAAE